MPRALCYQHESTACPFLIRTSGTRPRSSPVYPKRRQPVKKSDLALLLLVIVLIVFVLYHLYMAWFGTLTFHFTL
jgi:hypothetical protein